MTVSRALVLGLIFAVVTGLTLISNGFGIGKLPTGPVETFVRQKIRMALLVGLLVGFGAGMALAAAVL